MMRWAMLLCVLLSAPVAFAELKNGGFENWVDERRPEHWIALDPGSERTNDALKGDAAVRLYNWYEHFPGKLESGVQEKGKESNPGFAFDTPPSLLKGNYKYVGKKEDCETALAEIVFYDGTNQKPLHKVSLDLAVVETYTPFELKVSPDQAPAEATRVSVRFETDGRCESGEDACCYLYLDELELQ